MYAIGCVTAIAQGGGGPVGNPGDVVTVLLGERRHASAVASIRIRLIPGKPYQRTVICGCDRLCSPGRAGCERAHSGSPWISGAGPLGGVAVLENTATDVCLINLRRRSPPTVNSLPTAKPVCYRMHPDNVTGADAGPHVCALTNNHIRISATRADRITDRGSAGAGIQAVGRVWSPLAARR